MASSSPLARSQSATFAGPAGDIEALIESSGEATPRAFGVLCHPHPLHGGTLHNKVVHTLARSFQDLGAPTIRFNFRGVGKSAGTFAEGAGETEDALAVIAAGRARWPGAGLWLAGFSFGAGIAFRAARPAAAELLITVAPAVRLVDTSASKTPDCPWLIVQGDSDEVVEPATVLQWARGLQPAPTVTMLAGVGHFFHGRLRELASVVVEFARERGLARE